MGLWACDFTSCNVPGRLRKVSRCTQRIAIFDHGFKEALVNSFWTVSLLFCTVRLRKLAFCLVVPPFLLLKISRSLNSRQSCQYYHHPDVSWITWHSIFWMHAFQLKLGWLSWVTTTLVILYVYKYDARFLCKLVNSSGWICCYVHKYLSCEMVMFTVNNFSGYK